MGIVELLITCFVGLLGIGLPVAVLVVLYLVYKKLEHIEQLLDRKEASPEEQA